MVVWARVRRSRIFAYNFYACSMPMQKMPVVKKKKMPGQLSHKIRHYSQKRVFGAVRK
jgi:hypothetical protein